MKGEKCQNICVSNVWASQKTQRENQQCVVGALEAHTKPKRRETQEERTSISRCGTDDY